SIEDEDFGVRHILSVSFRLAEIEREIVLTPDYQQTRLLLAHPCLPFRVGVDVRSIIVEKIALNVGLAGLIQKVKLVRPQIWIIALHVGIATDVSRPRRRQRKQIGAKSAFVRLAIGPKRSPRFPIRPEAFVVRYRVLDDESIYSLRMHQCHTKTCGAAVILHVKRV